MRYLISIKPDYYDINLFRITLREGIYCEITFDEYNRTHSFQSVTLTLRQVENNMNIEFDIVDPELDLIKATKYNMTAYKFEIDEDGIYIFTEDDSILDQLSKISSIDITELYGN